MSLPEGSRCGTQDAALGAEMTILVNTLAVIGSLDTRTQLTYSCCKFSSSQVAKYMRYASVYPEVGSPEETMERQEETLLCCAELRGELGTYLLLLGVCYYPHTT